MCFKGNELSIEKINYIYKKINHMEDNLNNNPQQTPPPIQNTTQQQFNNQFGQIPVPNATAVLVLGILSIVFCFCYGLIGIILGIIALVLANKAMAIYKINPNSFTMSSYNNLKAGKVCAIIGLILSALMFIYVVVVFAIVGSAMIGSMPWSQMVR